MARISLFFTFLLCAVALVFALPVPNKATATVKKVKVNPGLTLKKTVREGSDSSDGTEDSTDDSTETSEDSEDDTTDDSTDSTEDSTDSDSDS